MNLFITTSLSLSTRAAVALLVILGVAINGRAQWHKDAGIGLATNGVSINLGAERPNDLSTGTTRLSLSLANIKHADESRIQNKEFANARPYIFQKVNSLYVARLGVGWKKNMSYAQPEKPQLSLCISAGPAWAVTKPYYIGYENNEGQLILGVQNQETLENQNRILGPTKWSKGINEASSLLGLHTEISINVKWNHSLYYQYWQTGLRLDYFPSAVELMYSKQNNAFACLFTSFSIGRK